MFYRLVTLAALVVISGSSAGASAPLLPDGSWWASLDAGEKAQAIVIGTNAYAAGYAAAKQTYSAYYEAKEKRLEAPLPAPAKTRWNAFSTAFARYYRVRETPVFDRDVAVYVTTLDRFYVPHGSFTDVPVPYLFGCLQNAPQYTCAEMGRFWRKQ